MSYDHLTFYIGLASLGEFGFKLCLLRLPNSLEYRDLAFDWSAQRISLELLEAGNALRVFQVRTQPVPELQPHHATVLKALQFIEQIKDLPFQLELSVRVTFTGSRLPPNRATRTTCIS